MDKSRLPSGFMEDWMRCGCAVRAWRVPAPGDPGLRCATCDNWVPWELFEQDRAEFNRIVAAQREDDPAGVRSFLVGVALAVAEWKEAEHRGEGPRHREPSPEEWRRAECLVDEMFGAGFGTGVFTRQSPGR
ncbi:MAG: hypothetical protein F4018_15265 [Acidobacteria bacterium]|nr:hypothetical protein [Acidobacteriota bacterium]MYK89582.1 hypothetical protein [Acidobacteriota bacterium]